MKELFKKFRQNSGAKTMTGLSEKAEGTYLLTFFTNISAVCLHFILFLLILGILSKAVELWPILQRPFAKDPIEDAIGKNTPPNFRICA